MLSLFQGVFDTSTAATSGLAVGDFLICLAAALVLGFVIALFYKYGTRYSKSFLVTLTLLPAIVSVIIIMVNGNIGAGVAVAGQHGGHVRGVLEPAVRGAASWGGSAERESSRFRRVRGVRLPN